MVTDQLVIASQVKMKPGKEVIKNTENARYAHSEIRN